MYFNGLVPETILLIFKKEVSNTTWSTDSAATRECFAVPEMMPGVDGVDGNVIVKLRSMAVVRMDR